MFFFKNKFSNTSVSVNFICVLWLNCDLQLALKKKKQTPTSVLKSRISPSVCLVKLTPDYNGLFHYGDIGSRSLLIVF